MATSAATVEKCRFSPSLLQPEADSSKNISRSRCSSSPSRSWLLLPPLVLLIIPSAATSDDRFSAGTAPGTALAADAAEDAGTDKELNEDDGGHDVAERGNAAAEAVVDMELVGAATVAEEESEDERER